MREAIATAIAGFLGRIGIKTTVAARPIALHDQVLNFASHPRLNGPVSPDGTIHFKSVKVAKQN